MTLAIGAIADDLTGATDLAGAFVGRGLRTSLSVGPGAVDPADHDAIVVALKSRSVPPAEAIEMSLAALSALRSAGADHIFFKYCSTFDSTPEGNIGPVGDALLDAVEQSLLMHCPAFPATGRAVMGGELFVHGVPLAATAMRHHPVNPMTESDLVKVLAQQVSGRVGLVPLQTVRKGPDAVAQQLRRLGRKGVRHAIIDAVNHDDLAAAAQAASGMRVTAGATGLGEALAGRLVRGGQAPSIEVPVGPTVVLAGSCSETTLAQLDHASAVCPVHRLDVDALASGGDVVGPAVAWAAGGMTTSATIIIAASASAAERQASPQSGIGSRIERAMGAIAAALIAKGVRRLVVAGGETSGAVVEALELRALTVGPTIDAGVPVVLTRSDDPLALILKSGNFGRPDLFIDPFGRKLWQA